VASIVTRCGYRCDLCLAYKENNRGLDGQKRISDGWFTYHGFRIPPQETRCDGCLTLDAERPRFVDAGCPVRACVLGKGLADCAGGAGYMCDKLGSRTVHRAAVEAKLGHPIPEQDYLDFVRPYENRARRDALR